LRNQLHTLLRITLPLHKLAHQTEMSANATQTVLTEFCTQHGLTIALGLISAIQTTAQVQSFLGFLRLIPTVPAERLNELDRNLQLRVRDMEIEELKSEVERLKAANAALQARITTLSRPAVKPVIPTVPRPGPAKRQSLATASKPGRKRKASIPGEAKSPRKRSKSTPKPALPAPPTPDGSGSEAEKDDKKNDNESPDPKGSAALVSTDAEEL